MKLHEKPLYRDEKDLQTNVRALFENTGKLVDALNGDRTTSAMKVIYGGTVSSGTATVPLETAGYRLFLAVIGGVPTLAVQHEGVLAARGGNAETETAMTATIYGGKMTFSATSSLDKLIVIF